MGSYMQEFLIYCRHEYDYCVHERLPEVKTFIHDKKTGNVLGRSKQRWKNLGRFQVTFMAVMGLHFFIMLCLAFQVLDHRMPMYILKESTIGTRPGLTARPLNVYDDLSGTLVWYKQSEPVTYEPYTNNIAEFYEIYNASLPPGGRQAGVPYKGYGECNWNQPNPKVNHKCSFDIAVLTKDCTIRTAKIVGAARTYPDDVVENPQFGFDKGKPCIILKINRIIGWMPEPFTDEDVNSGNIPKDMPDDVKQAILASATPVHKTDYPPHGETYVFVRCYGKNPHDQDFIGAMTYGNYKGTFPTYFFPYLNKPGFLAPIVELQFQNVKKGVLISVTCKLWAKNINFDKGDTRGMIRFDILVDE